MAGDHADANASDANPDSPGAAANGHPGETDPRPAVAIFRLGVGLAQGLLLYGLYHQFDTQTWPVTNPYAYAPLLAFGLLIPIFLSQAAGRMRTRTLAVWIVIASAAVIGLAAYDRYRTALTFTAWSRDEAAPDVAMLFFAFAGLFIAQSLIAAGDAGSSFLTRYRNYFDATWKFGVQLALAAVFVGVFWGVLWLGAYLFELIKLEFLSDLLDHAWFWIPASALATASAIHLTDVRTRLVSGIRTVVLTLLSWLLPLMVLIAVGFVLALPATGLDPLWSTKNAAGILLTAAAALVILINAAYQDGENENARPFVLRYSELIASALLVPLVGLAAYALALRVQQYGWTADRIAIFACVLVASCYALGYTAAALFSLLGGRWMNALEPVNVFNAFLILVLLLALFTPAADPARLSVASQVSRLKAGMIAPANFDFTYLRAKGGRFGEEALHALAELKSGPRVAEIRQGARYVLNQTGAPPQLSANDLLANITVHPSTRKLAATFLNQNWLNTTSIGVPACLTSDFKCDAFFADMDGDGVDEILIVYGSDDGWWGAVIKQAKNGSWVPIATVTSPSCKGSLTALRAGHFSLVTPVPPFRDLIIGRERVAVLPIERVTSNCPD